VITVWVAVEDIERDRRLPRIAGGAEAADRARGDGLCSSRSERWATRRAVAGANNRGLWAFHCDLLYHAHADMFTTRRYV